MDAQTQFLLESDAAHAVLGRPGNFILVDLANVGRAAEDATSAGLHYCGVVGLRSGVPAAYCDHADALQVMLDAGTEYARRMADRKPEGDSVAFLSALHALPDPR